MCSISGIIDFNARRDMRAAIKRMCDTAFHRGPDGEGYLFSSLSNNDGRFTKDISAMKDYAASNVSLGHRRLKIIDLSDKADQPMSNEDGSLWIVQNGEIYNYLELRKELIAKGHVFRSSSDTEVIIHAYEEYGEDCLNRFNGMWAFTLFDSRRGALFCARDRLGKKPFFYNITNGVFIFSSEIKSLLASGLLESGPNNKAVFAYLTRQMGYDSLTGDTYFQGVTQLKPGHYMVVSKDAVYTRKYWEIPFPKPEEKDERHCVDMFAGLLSDAVKIRLRSDTDVSSYLSGGLDTSSVVASAGVLCGKAGMTTFTSCFDDPLYDERPYVEKMKRLYDLKSIYVFPKPNDLLKDLEGLVWHQEEPFLHLNVYAQWQILKAVKERGFKVVLNGHGGDEGLAGYRKDFTFYFADLLKTLRLSEYIRQMGLYDAEANHVSKGALAADSFRIVTSNCVPRGMRRYLKRSFMRYPTLSADFCAENNVTLTEPVAAPKGFLRRSSYMGYAMYPIPDWLKYEDRASMAHSVESRSPFLDYRLVEFMAALPNDLKIRNGATKYILRSAMKGVLPEAVRLRKDKSGFPTPSGAWFRGEIRKYAEEIINSETFAKRGIFNIKKVKEMFVSHCNGKMDLKFEIWSWINLELWMRKFCDRKS